MLAFKTEIESKITVGQMTLSGEKHYMLGHIQKKCPEMSG